MFFCYKWLPIFCLGAHALAFHPPNYFRHCQKPPTPTPFASKKAYTIYLHAFVRQFDYRSLNKESEALVLRIKNARLSSRLASSPKAPAPATPIPNSSDIEEFQHDMNRIRKLRPDDKTSPKRLISSESSYTEIWNNLTWSEHCSPCTTRYWRHIKRWPYSTTARRILPTVFFNMLWAIVVTIGVREFGHIGDFLRRTSFSGALGIFLGPIALLLTLRTNASLARLLEARAAWGRTVLHARALMSLVMTYVAPVDRQRALLVGRYLAVFGWSFKGMFRNEPDRDVIEALLPPKEAAWIAGQRKRPTAILSRVRRLCADLSGVFPAPAVAPAPASASATSAQAQTPTRNAGAGTTGDGAESGNQNDGAPASAPPQARSGSGFGSLPFAALLQIEQRLHDLDGCIGVCERLYASPTPPTYTRHTSRVLCLYLTLLPLALVGLGLPSAPLVGTIAITSYVLVGIDEIGVEVENPFPWLPLQQLAGAIAADVADQVVMHADMPAGGFGAAGGAAAA